MQVHAVLQGLITRCELTQHLREEGLLIGPWFIHIPSLHHRVLISRVKCTNICGNPPCMAGLLSLGRALLGAARIGGLPA